MMYYEINETAARQARSLWSFSDYENGSKTTEYKQQVNEVYKAVDELPEELKEKGAEIADRYARRLADWYNKQFRIEMMCPSVMICGAGNFPTRKKEKQNEAQDRHYQLYNEIQEIPYKISRLARGENIIKSSDANAVEQLQKKIEAAEAKQIEMKAINAYFRKNKTIDGYKDFDEKEAAEIKWVIKTYGVPYPSFTLTNNNAKIKNAKARKAQLERVKNAPKSDESEIQTDLFKVVENAEIMRLQLFFDGKPEAETRTILKKHAYKWAPSNGCWQRQLTANAKYDLKRLIEELAQ